MLKLGPHPEAHATMLKSFLRFMLIFAVIVIAAVGPISVVLDANGAVSNIFADLEEDHSDEDLRPESISCVLEIPDFAVDLQYAFEIPPSLCGQTYCDHLGGQRGPPVA